MSSIKCTEDDGQHCCAHDMTLSIRGKGKRGNSTCMYYQINLETVVQARNDRGELL